MFREKITGTTAERPQVRKLMAVLALGDVVITPAVDRLSRDATDLLLIARDMQRAGAGLRSIAEPVPHHIPILPSLSLPSLASRRSSNAVASPERTARGRADAKAKGVKFGRKPTLTLHQQQEARERLAAGETQRSVARSYNVSQATISRLAISGEVSVSWEFWVVIGLYAATGIAVFAGRNWLKAWIQNGVEYRFNSRLKSSERSFVGAKRNLKANYVSKKRKSRRCGKEFSAAGHSAKRSSISVVLKLLRSSGNGIVALSPYKGLSASVAVLNVDALARRADDPKIKLFIAAVATAVKRDPEALSNNPATNERPFVSALAWAYFFSYLTIVSIAFASLKLAEVGFPNLSELFAKDNIRNLLKAVLPHRSEFIDRNEPNAYHYLLDEIEQSLLTELQKILRGEDQDFSGDRAGCAYHGDGTNKFIAGACGRGFGNCGTISVIFQNAERF